MSKFTEENAAENGAKGGKKSKRLPLNEQWTAKLEEFNGDDKQLLGEIFDILLECARKGNVKAVQELLDRSFGKAKQSIDVNANIISNPLADSIDRMIQENKKDKNFGNETD